MKYGALFREGCKQLETAGIDEAKLDARLLLEFVCGTNRNDLLAHGDRQVSDEEEARYREVLELRAGRIPLQQITHSQDCVDTKAGHGNPGRGSVKGAP